jgi:DNA-binding XRE family transcriptional regulator
MIETTRLWTPGHQPPPSSWWFTPYGGVDFHGAKVVLLLGGTDPGERHQGSRHRPPTEEPEESWRRQEPAEQARQKVPVGARDLVWLTDMGIIPYHGWWENDQMTVSYDRALAKRRGTVSAAARRETLVFEKAYFLAVQIIELREKRGLTQAQLARLSGIDQGDISRIERGSATPNEKTLIRLADALDADLHLVARHPRA